MKEIKGIGFKIPSDNNDYLALDSLSSLSECDIAIFNPSFKDTSYSTYTGSYRTDDGMFNGRSLYNHDSTAKIIEHKEHWKKEIKSYLQSGKTLFIVLTQKNQFYIHTGRQEHSGTGRNRQTTNIVTEATNYNFLPLLNDIDYSAAHGQQIVVTENLFKTFFDEFKEFIKYEMHIDDKKNRLKVCFTTKNKDKILGGILEASGGNIVFLPKIDFDISSNHIYKNNQTSDWSNLALQKGKRFTQIITELDSLIKKSSERTPKPSWLVSKEFELKQSILIRKQIEKNKKLITNILQKNDLLESQLIESEKLNDLLYETGKTLENAVTFALNILGFEAENYDDGILELDQIIISPEKVRYVGECEGKDNKAIDITKFRQLSDALNEDFERDDVHEKANGILFGNPFRLESPGEREAPFTEKCIKGALREKIALVQTSDLYKVAKYLLENDDDAFKKRCRESIENGLGTIIQFPAPKE